MKKRSSIFATRLFAVLALAAAVVAVVLLVSAGLKDDPSDKSGKNANHPSKQANNKHPRTKAKTYEVQTGDTLTSIAQQTGVPVAEIQALNPQVDPQILIAGEKLKLK